MSINAAQVHFRTLLDGLPVPGGLNIEAYITPPDPEVDYVQPHAFIWPSDGEETRLTIPRMVAAPNGVSGSKQIMHIMDIFLVWFAQNDDPEADTWFPGMVDAVMIALRTSSTPAVVQDVYTNATTQIIDVGERMTYKTAVSAVADERFNRYDALISCHVMELITS